MHLNRKKPSLGAYECGVCKVLAKHDIEFDIIAGTSIGAINAAIIATGYTKEDGIRRNIIFNYVP
jgi:predicted acylesterase/phospholipase RssA